MGTGKGLALYLVGLDTIGGRGTRSKCQGEAEGRGYPQKYPKVGKFQNPRSIKKVILQGRKCRKTRG